MELMPYGADACSLMFLASVKGIKFESSFMKEAKIHLHVSFLSHLSSLITDGFTLHISLPRRKMISYTLHIIHILSGNGTHSVSVSHCLACSVDYFGFFGHLSCLFYILSCYFRHSFSACMCFPEL